MHMTLELSYESDNKNFHKEISFPYEMNSNMFDEIVRQLTAVAMRVHQTGEGVTNSDTINKFTLTPTETPKTKEEAASGEETITETKKKAKEGKRHD